MREILSRLNAVSGMKGSLVVTPDGLPIAVDLPTGVDRETMAGISASIATLLNDWAHQAGAGAMSVGMLDAKNMRLFVSPITWGYLIGLAEKRCTLGEARTEMRAATAALNTVCATLTRAVQEEESTNPDGPVTKPRQSNAWR